ncbi:M48 family metalloprotease [Flavobacterium rhizosphaerae]|uniref:M48 family metalloprotease n=1 Tax=Flavobacterium rhizosphaerae TaxID=3163298 RepID=A0ABW8Z2G6_9FLAO
MVAALCCMVPAMAQKNFGSAKYTAMCSYYGETITGDIIAYESGTTVQKAVAEIMSVIGLKPNFELRVANVPNAAAVVIKNKRYILYNPKFMNQINKASGTNWAAISILAHEIGHHLNGHTLDNVGSRPQTELEADEFSGFVLRKMGATLPDA